MKKEIFLMTHSLDSEHSERVQRIRDSIELFLQERLQRKLEKLKKDDPQYDKKHAELITQFQPTAWLEEATRRVQQIQAVTHALKPIHPDARGTNLYCAPNQLPNPTQVGSHCLKADFSSDVVGNAAALDVYKLLKMEVDGHSLLQWLLDNDTAAITALHPDPETAQQWRAAFVGLTQARNNLISSHVYAKQLYWLVGEDATDDTQYHLLAPLHPTSLVHVVYDTLQEARFGEANKAARAARKERKAHAGTLYDYPNLAIQKMGGTKPQNISQLNSERRGNNYLLASLPPQWQSSSTRQPWGIRSVFERMLIAREGVRHTLKTFLQFLRSNPPTNMDTRNRVEGYVSDLIDELVTLAGELQHGWPSGWSADSRCEMVRPEQLWLDPHRAGTDPDFRQEWLWMDWPAQIGHRFGNWLNTQLEGEFRVGDAELRQWKKELLLDESDDGWAHSLHRLRAQQDAPQYIAARQGVIA